MKINKIFYNSYSRAIFSAVVVIAMLSFVYLFPKTGMLFLIIAGCGFLLFCLIAIVYFGITEEVNHRQR